MINQFPVGKIVNVLRNWSVPIISVSAFVPFVFIYLASSESTSKQSPEVPPVPALSQIPSPTKKWDKVSSLTQRNLEQPQVIQKTQPKPDVTPKATPSTTAYQKTTSHPPKKQSLVKPSPSPQPRQTAARTTPAPLPPTPANYTPPPLEIRVAVLRDASSTNLGTSTTAVITDRNGQVLQSLSPSQGLWVNPAGSGLSVGNWQMPAVVFVQPDKNGLVYLGDRWYRGRMLLVSQGSSILAVNYVNLEEYLYSVVGSEMHSTAPMEALKAQAIAARSYALVHMIRPANPWYHLGNTQRWQVYKGLQSEYNTSHQAVNETAGQILSYKGGVVESLYAATDEIVSRAHGGRGMSQIGAYGLANQGYDYQQILGRYYPGVGLARLVLQQ